MTREEILERVKEGMSLVGQRDWGAADTLDIDLGDIERDLPVAFVVEGLMI
jgi:hypothetical protein